MRFSQDDLKEALNHKDWVGQLVNALTDETRTLEEGPVAVNESVDVPNAVVKIEEGDAYRARVRTAVALALVPVDALIPASGPLTAADHAALRLREQFGGKGETAVENEAYLERTFGRSGDSNTDASSEETKPPRGKFPESWPPATLQALAALDPPVDTFGKLRKLIATGTEEKPWYSDVKGIGEATAKKLEAAAELAPADDED